MPAAGERAIETLIALALEDEDHAFVEAWCVRIGETALDPALRGTSALAAGHLARRFRTVSAEAARMVRALAADPEVRAHYPGVIDGLTDVEQCAPAAEKTTVSDP